MVTQPIKHASESLGTFSLFACLGTSAEEDNFSVIFIVKRKEIKL